MKNGRPRNTDRENAVDLGLLTYEGKSHFRCGTTTRYVVGAGCVHCARLIATEQREARKFLRSQRAEEGVTITIDDISEENVRDAFGLDTPTEDGLDADDAEARRQAAIDELM